MNMSQNIVRHSLVQCRAAIKKKHQGKKEDMTKVEQTQVSKQSGEENEQTNMISEKKDDQPDNNKHENERKSLKETEKIKNCNFKKKKIKNGKN